MTKFLKLKKKFNKNNKEILEMLIDRAFDDAFASAMKSDAPAKSEMKSTDMADKSKIVTQAIIPPICRY